MEQNSVGEDDGESLENNDGSGIVIETIVEVCNGGVHFGGEKGEEAFEVGEEWRVVESPGAGLVGVPKLEGEGVS